MDRRKLIRRVGSVVILIAFVLTVKYFGYRMLLILILILFGNNLEQNNKK